MQNLEPLDTAYRRARIVCPVFIYCVCVVYVCSYMYVYNSRNIETFIPTVPVQIVFGLSVILPRDASHVCHCRMVKVATSFQVSDDDFPIHSSDAV